MTFDWQFFTALAIVALAVLYVGRMAWKSLRGKSSGCGGCGTCSTGQSGDSRPSPLVKLGEADEISPRS